MISYNYKIKDVLERQNKNGYNVFSAFSCIGGSCIGYKLAGFNVIGINEIDKRLVDVYKRNFDDCKYIYNQDIRELLNLAKEKKLPQELYNLDVFDCSPPCTPFSIAGKMEKGWGKEKKFAEGQKKQTLDDLAFIALDLIKELQPKVVVLENVIGLLFDKCSYYKNKILKTFNEIGYNVDIYKISCADCGVCQLRPRCFFIASRKDLPFLLIKIIKKQHIIFGRIKEHNITDENLYKFSNALEKTIQYYTFGEKNLINAFKKATGKDGYFSYKVHLDDKICFTLAGDIIRDHLTITDDKKLRKLTNTELLKISGFPLDFNFISRQEYNYLKYVVSPIVYELYGRQIKEYLDKIK